MLTDFATRLGVRLSIITIDSTRLDGLPTTAVLSAATYARLLIPDLLPHASRALYLDADAIVVAATSPNYGRWTWVTPLLQASTIGVAGTSPASWGLILRST